MIHTYSLTSSSTEKILSRARDLLKPHLPVSLALYRRLQFGRFFPSTTLLTNLSLDDDKEDINNEENSNDDDNNKSGISSAGVQHHSSQEPWLMAFVDRSVRPETEVWLFGTWEADLSIDIKNENSEESRAIDSLVLAALHGMKTIEVPVSIHKDPADTTTNGATKDGTKDAVGFSRSDYGGHLADTNIMLWGGVHERSVPVLQRANVLSVSHNKITLMPNWTFLWNVEELRRRETSALPEGLRWGEVRREDIALVRSSTQIPRQERTLAVLPSVAIFPTDSADAAPIAWAFVGLDASLTTLHVQPQYRRRGLAKLLTTKVFTEKMERFWEDDTTKWAFGYVIVGNKQSEGMCRSLGGKSDYESFWLRVDLGRLQ